MVKFKVGWRVGVFQNDQAPDVIGRAYVREVRENEPQNEGGFRNVYRVEMMYDSRQAWVREEYLDKTMDRCPSPDVLMLKSNWHVFDGACGMQPLRRWSHDLLWLPMSQILWLLGLEQLSCILHKWSEPDDHCCCRF